MAYSLRRKRPSSTQRFNSFKIVTNITEKSNGDKAAAENLLSRLYYKVMQSAAATPGRLVPVLPPPGDGSWSWNRSFDIACSVASQCDKAEIPLLVPEEANIFIGKELVDMDEEEAEDALAALDFEFDKHLEDDEHDDIFSEMIAAQESKPRWLGDFGGDLERMRKDNLAALVDVEMDDAVPSDDASDWEQEAEDIKSIVESIPQETFAKFLGEQLKERDMTPAALARSSNMMSSTVVRLLKAENPVPEKSQVLAIGIALGLAREQFEHMLQLCGYCLSECVPRDMVVSYYLDKGIYSLEQVNRALFIYDIPTLGTHAPVKK